MKRRRRRADKEDPSDPPPGVPDESVGGHAACRARADELEAAASELRGRLAAARAALSEQGGRLAAAAATEGELRASLASAEAAAAEQGGRLAAAEAAAADLRAANEALTREHAAVLASSREPQAALSALGPALSFSAVEAALRTARFLERRRDFGAELPAGVLLHIMDRAPDRKCVSAGIFFGVCFKGGEPLLSRSAISLSL